MNILAFTSPQPFLVKLHHTRISFLAKVFKRIGKSKNRWFIPFHSSNHSLSKKALYKKKNKKKEYFFHSSNSIDIALGGVVKKPPKAVINPGGPTPGNKLNKSDALRFYSKEKTLLH